MNRLTTTLLFAACLAFMPVKAVFADDMAGVKAASDGFYAALAVIDDGTAMGKVWAHTPYVTFVGPRSKAPIVGWDALAQYWAKANKLFSSRVASISDPHVHVNGNLAWELGTEIGDNKMADGTPTKSDWMATNIYEKLDGKWMMVSHHVQPKPQ